jgi:hypothetical protein
VSDLTYAAKALELDRIPPGAVVWKTTSRQYTAQELCEELKAGSDVGRQFVSDLLRVARDLIARKART